MFRIAFTACASLLAGSLFASANDLDGRPTVVDGDSFTLQIRLHGIDAPEIRQTCKSESGQEYPCGQRANDALMELIGGRVVTCVKRDQDTRYGRPVAVCYADGVDLGAAMVERGWAVAYRKYSNQYVKQEEQARSAKLGMWAGTFEMPDAYRLRLRNPATPQAPMPLVNRDQSICPPPSDSPECTIKGNIGKNGRIYHMPGSPSYQKTVISSGKGERYFCSEQDAVACGWKKAGSR